MELIVDIDPATQLNESLLLNLSSRRESRKKSWEEVLRPLPLAAHRTRSVTPLPILISLYKCLSSGKIMN